MPVSRGDVTFCDPHPAECASEQAVLRVKNVDVAVAASREQHDVSLRVDLIPTPGHELGYAEAVPVGEHCGSTSLGRFHLVAILFSKRLHLFSR